jgi:hypothetical protein
MSPPPVPHPGHHPDHLGGDLVQAAIRGAGGVEQVQRRQRGGVGVDDHQPVADIGGQPVEQVADEVALPASARCCNW